jgi:hypothetical protein
MSIHYSTLSVLPSQWKPKHEDNTIVHKPYKKDSRHQTWGLTTYSAISVETKISSRLSSLTNYRSRTIVYGAQKN